MAIFIKNSWAAWLRRQIRVSPTRCASSVFSIVCFLLWEGWAVHHLALSQLSFQSTAETLQLHSLILWRVFLCICVCVLLTFPLLIFVCAESRSSSRPSSARSRRSSLSNSITMTPSSTKTSKIQEPPGLQVHPSIVETAKKTATNEWFAKSRKQNSKKGTKEFFHRHPKPTFYNRSKLLLTVISFVTSHSSSSCREHNSKHVSLDQLT